MLCFCSFGSAPFVAKGGGCLWVRRAQVAARPRGGGGAAVPVGGGRFGEAVGGEGQGDAAEPGAAGRFGWGMLLGLSFWERFIYRWCLLGGGPRAFRKLCGGWGSLMPGLVGGPGIHLFHY